MNFISHFYLDRDRDDSWFFAGVSTPDLVSVFDRNVRLKGPKLPILRENDATPAEVSFYHGVLRHFEVDRIFHTSPFFKEESGLLTSMLQENFEKGTVKRAFFVAHVAFELILDKILIQEDPQLTPSFYSHLEKFPIEEYVKLTEWVTKQKLPSYQAFMQRFVDKKYLYHYVDWEHLFYVLKRIMIGVGILEVNYLHSETFLDLMREYEAGLKDRCYPAFARLNEQLIEV
ncbi:MAG: hypothetical protein AAFR61_08160 [Bacteroidota bacterium]